MWAGQAGVKGQTHRSAGHANGWTCLWSGAWPPRRLRLRYRANKLSFFISVAAAGRRGGAELARLR